MDCRQRGRGWVVDLLGVLRVFIDTPVSHSHASFICLDCDNAMGKAFAPISHLNLERLTVVYTGEENSSIGWPGLDEA